MLLFGACVPQTGANAFCNQAPLQLRDSPKMVKTILRVGVVVSICSLRSRTRYPESNVSIDFCGSFIDEPNFDLVIARISAGDISGCQRATYALAPCSFPLT